MKKFNLLLNESLFQDEDTLREFDLRWNEPQKQKINGGVFNSKGKYYLDWDRPRGYSRFKERDNKIHGILEKGIGKKFNDIYSKLCKSEIINKRVWRRSVREKFLSNFNDTYCNYYIDNEGLIQHKNNYKKPRIHQDIKIPYEKPYIVYQINHKNLESIANTFILEFGENIYYHLLFVNEIKESEYNKYINNWDYEACKRVMEATRRSREWKPKFYTLERIENLFHFIFDKMYQYYKKIIKYGTKEYIAYKRIQKRNKRNKNYLTNEERAYYDAVMRWYKKFGNYSPVNFINKYNYVFNSKELPLSPNKRRELKGKKRWNS
jgi:hypothetical protein